MNKRLIIIAIMSFMSLFFIACNRYDNTVPGNEEIESSSSIDLNETFCTLTPEKLASEEHNLASALLDNVHKYSISNPNIWTVDIILKCKYYHNGELIEEGVLLSEGRHSDDTITIYLAIVSDARVIMSIKRLKDADQINNRLEYTPNANTNLFEYTTINKEIEIYEGNEIPLLVLRSSTENPNADPMIPESSYEDMLFLTMSIDLNS